MVQYYDRWRREANAVTERREKAVWALVSIHLVGVQRRSSGSATARGEGAVGVCRPWVRVYSEGRLYSESRRSGDKGSGGAGSTWSGRGVAVRIGEDAGASEEVKVEVFDDETADGGTGDRLLFSVWQHVGFMP